MPILMYFDQYGTPRARSHRRLEHLAGVLEDEVQGSPEVGLRFLEAVDRVRAGRQDGWEETGNAYTVTIRPGGVTITLEVAEGPRLETSLDTFEEAVLHWLGFLRLAA